LTRVKVAPGTAPIVLDCDSIGRGETMRLSGLSILAGLLLTAAEAALPASAQDIGEGRRLAERRCAGCHAIGQTGASPHASAPPFRLIAAKGHVDDLQEALAEGITVGHPDMPEFEFTPDEIADFLGYLKSLAPVAR
jgi:cytochrome c